MELTSKSRLPRLVKERIIMEYLSGSKTSRMLSVEHGISINAINHMISRHKDKFLPNFGPPSISATMKPKITTQDSNRLLQENEELKRQLKLAQLKLEGYEIMGDILEEEYGIALLKKSAAKQSPDSENDTQK